MEMWWSIFRGGSLKQIYPVKCNSKALQVFEYTYRVRICIKAVFAHPVQKVPCTASVAEAVVSTTNLISRDQDVRRVSEPPVKAVVILLEDDSHVVHLCIGYLFWT